MSSVATALGGLGQDAQGRVLRWAAERYGVTLANKDGRRGGAGGGGAASEVYAGAGDVTEEEVAEEAPTYQHFAELFATASRKTNEDKALVVAY